MLFHPIPSFLYVSNSCLACCHELRLGLGVSDQMWTVTSVPVVCVQVQFPYTPLMFTAVKRKAFTGIRVLPGARLSVAKESKTISTAVLKVQSGNSAPPRFP